MYFVNKLKILSKAILTTDVDVCVNGPLEIML